MPATELASQLLAQTSRSPTIQPQVSVPVTPQYSMPSISHQQMTVNQLLAEIALQQQRQQQPTTPTLQYVIPSSVGSTTSILPLRLSSDGSQLIQTVSSGQLVQSSDQPIILRRVTTVDQVPSVTAVPLPPPIIVNAQHLQQQQPPPTPGYQQLQVSVTIILQGCFKVSYNVVANYADHRSRCSYCISICLRC